MSYICSKFYSAGHSVADERLHVFKMKMTEKRAVAFCTLYIFVVVCMELTFGYPQFQSQIPNGDKIPHPCKTNYIWRGVGHKNPNGGGDRNPFGLAFYAAGKKWTQELCQADTDGDGLSNGQELGDPNCTWLPGATPTRTTTLTHPGICELSVNPACANKISQREWIDCNYEDFKCDGISNPETKNRTVRFPVTTVPAKETSYFCMTFDLPSNKEYHLIALKPIINNTDVMHHIVLFGCENDTSKVDKPYECGMSAGSDCSKTLGLWTIGMSGQCFHKNAGIPIGLNGVKKAALQFSWNNPERQSDYSDSSGVILYYTDKLRENDAGIFRVGQKSLIIPPGEERVTVTSNCPGDCTKLLMKGPVYITAAINHMHYLGIEQRTIITHSNGIEESLASDEVYNYDSPLVHTFADPVKLDRNDALTSVCVFKSTSRSGYTYFGEETSDEMCLSFLWYYPKENIPTGSCTNFGNITSCDWRNDIVEGCDYRNALDTSIPSVFETYTSVTSSCSVDGRGGKCSPGCSVAVKEAKKKPCFKGSIGMFLRNATRFSEGFQKQILENFYNGLDSCDAGVASEQNIDDGECKPGDICDGVPTHRAVFYIVISLCIICKLVL